MSMALAVCTNLKKESVALDCGVFPPLWFGMEFAKQKQSGGKAPQSKGQT